MTYIYWGRHFEMSGDNFAQVTDGLGESILCTDLSWCEILYGSLSNFIA